MNRACQAQTVAALTDFRSEREVEGTAWPSMLSLPEAVWRAMVVNSRRIVWPGAKPEGPKQVIINANGEEEEVNGDPNSGKAQTKAAILNAAIRCGAVRLTASDRTGNKHGRGGIGRMCNRNMVPESSCMDLYVCLLDSGNPCSPLMSTKKRLMGKAYCTAPPCQAVRAFMSLVGCARHHKRNCNKSYGQLMHNVNPCVGSARQSG